MNLITIAAAILEIEGTVSEFGQRVEAYRTARSIPGRQKQLAGGQLEFYLNDEDGSAYAIVRVLKGLGETVKIGVYGVNRPGDPDQINDQRLIRLRADMPAILETMTTGINPEKIRSIDNRLEGEVPPLTAGERANIARQQAQYREKRQLDGFHSRTLLDAIFDTTPELLMGVILEYHLKNKLADHPFWKTVELKPSVENLRRSDVGLYVRGHHPLGFMGQIIMIPTSEKTISVQVITASDIVAEGDPAEAARYFLAIESLTSLAAHLIERTPVYKSFIQPLGQASEDYSNMQLVSSETNGLIDKSKEKMVYGRPASTWYDLAYEEKNARGLTMPQAFEWMTQQIKKDKHIDLTKVPELAACRRRQKENDKKGHAKPNGTLITAKPDQSGMFQAHSSFH